MSSQLPRLVHLASGQLPDVPADDGWLSSDERAACQQLRLEKRRNDWRLGRWLARQAIRAAAAAELPDIAIVAAPDGAPEVRGLDLPVTLTLSHRHGRGLAAAALGTSPIGCDLELIEPRSERFVRDWLTTPESSRIFEAGEDQRPLLANLCWSAREAASKVLRVGLRFDTRSFQVELPESDAPGLGAPAAWQALAVTATRTGARFTGVWRVREGFVETVLGLGEIEIRERQRP